LETGSIERSVFVNVLLGSQEI